MKQLTAVFSFLFISMICYSQDTILKRNSEKILAKVIEITPTEIKYKKTAFLDGPTYIDKKSEIQMIVYSNGIKELFEPEPVKEVVVANNDYYGNNSFSNNHIEDFRIHYRYQNRTINQPQMQKILMNTKDKEIMRLVAKSKEARKVEFISFAAIPFGIAALMVVSSNSFGSNVSGQNTSFAVGGLCLAAAITCPIISGIKRKQKVKYNSEAIELYNQKY